MRFIHIADLHLGSSPEAEFLWGKNRAEEIWDSFAAVIDACNEKEIDLLLIAGDLFDRPPVWADLDRAAKLFAGGKRKRRIRGGMGRGRRRR